MFNFITKYLDKKAVERIQNRPEAKDLLISSSDSFNVEHTGFGQDSMVDAIGNALPDMMWAKAIDGKYLWANQRIIDGLLFSGTLENTIGRLDKDMAEERRRIIGPENHTFGIVCGNSDVVVLEKEKPERFLEFGLVTGKPMYLEVHKDVLRDKDGKVIGTVGTGRELTDEYLSMTDISKRIDTGSITLDEVKKEMEKILNKYYFEA